MIYTEKSFYRSRNRTIRHTGTTSTTEKYKHGALRVRDRVPTKTGRPVLAKRIPRDDYEERVKFCGRTSKEKKKKKRSAKIGKACRRQRNVRRGEELEESERKKRDRENTRVPLGHTRASNLDVPIADTTARLQPMRSRDLSRIGGA